MKVWAVSNQKGGVGKTTTVVSLGGWQALRGQRTLVVDLDPHGSLTAYFGFDPDGLEATVYEVFQGRATAVLMQRLLRPTGLDNLTLLPASTALATLDRQLGARQGMGLALHHALQAVGDQFDVVLLDSPPMLGVLMVNALAAAEQLIIPVQTEFLALKGLERMLNTLDMVGRSRPQALPHLIVPTLFDRRTRASVEALRALRRQYGEAVWPRMIPVDTRFRDASRQGQPLPLLDPAARGSQAYASLLNTLTVPGDRSVMTA